MVTVAALGYWVVVDQYGVTYYKQNSIFSDHQVFHKWAQLSQPRNPAAGTVGFLKIDVSVIFRGDIQVMPVIVNDEKVPE